MGCLETIASESRMTNNPKQQRRTNRVFKSLHKSLTGEVAHALFPLPLR